MFEAEGTHGAEEAQSGLSAQKLPAFKLALNKASAHHSDVNCVRWSPVDPTLLASAGDDNTIRLWRFTPDVDSHI